MSEALEQLRLSNSLSFEDRALQAELELLAANRETAYRIAVDIAGRATSTSVVARALAVAGRIEIFSGKTVSGHHKLLRAREAASETGDAVLVAWTIGQHVESNFGYVSFEAAVGDLPAYRRAAQRSGSALVLASLHRLLAEAELKSGRGLRALKELSLSGLHIENTGHLVGRAHLNLAQSAAYGLLGDLRRSFEHAKAAEALAEKCGAKTLLRAARLNVCYCQTQLGHFDDATRTIDLVTPPDVVSADASLNKAGTQLTLLTALRRTQEAYALDTQFAPLSDSRRSVAADGYDSARLPHLMTLGRFDEAAAIGLRSVSSRSSSHDRNFLDRIATVTAEALIRGGSPHKALPILGSVVVGAHGELPEFIAMTQHVSGALASIAAPAALDHYQRAARIFAHLGQIVGMGEALYAAASLRASLAEPGSDAAAVPHITTFYAPPPTTFGRVDVPSDATSTTTPDAVSSAVRAAAAMVDLTSRPALAGYELLSLVASSEAASTSVLLAKKGERTSVLGWTGSAAPDDALRTGAATDELVTIALGTERDREVSVVVRPRNQQSARTTLLALQRLVGHGLTLHRAAVTESEKSAIWPEPLPEQQLGFVCASESMLDLLAVTRRVANSPLTVLITGETGTGKELLAHAVHKCSPRAKQRFTPFNCTAVSRDMLDSQLFGYRKGAFTGAADAFPGVIRGAAGGTLFLDEIGEIGMDVQPKLLRFLESNDVHPLGEASPVKVDVRIVAATNANLDRLVAEGKFREDLYYRLNVVKLTIPPLRERREEIPLLLDHFLERTQRESSKSGIRIGDTTSEYLLLYDWPGNVRELANEVRRAVAMAESGAVLMPEHLSPRIAASRRTVPVGQRPPAPTELLVRRDQPLTAAVEHVERAMIMDALRVYSNVEDAARALGLSRKGLYLKRQRLKIDEV